MMITSPCTSELPPIAFTGRGDSVASGLLRETKNKIRNGARLFGICKSSPEKVMENHRATSVRGGISSEDKDEERPNWTRLFRFCKSSPEMVGTTERREAAVPSDPRLDEARTPELSPLGCSELQIKFGVGHENHGVWELTPRKDLLGNFWETKPEQPNWARMFTIL